MLFLCLLISLTGSEKHGSLKFRGSYLPYHCLAAIFALVASVLPSMCVTLADEVSAVSPIVNTTLLFVIVFTAMSCRGEEKITRWW